MSTYLLIGVAVILIVFMFINSRRNRKRQAEQKSKIVPGIEIMTNFGLFGKLLSIDELSNVAEVETTPGTIIRVHRQTITKAVDPVDGESSDAPRSVEEAMERANREQADKEAAEKIDTQAPEYGERVDDDPITKATSTPAKRAPRAPKKTEE
jgi:preprotein translocase subunit YajC